MLKIEPWATPEPGRPCPRATAELRAGVLTVGCAHIPPHMHNQTANREEERYRIWPPRHLQIKDTKYIHYNWTNETSHFEPSRSSSFAATEVSICESKRRSCGSVGCPGKRVYRLKTAFFQIIDKKRRYRKVCCPVLDPRERSAFHKSATSPTQGQARRP